jgi:hypothetical protein
MVALHTSDLYQIALMVLDCRLRRSAGWLWRTLRRKRQSRTAMTISYYLQSM